MTTFKKLSNLFTGLQKTHTSLHFVKRPAANIQKCQICLSIPTHFQDTLSSLWLTLLKFRLMYGTKIKMIRELRGFSQEHMAGKLGIPQNSYSRIETNQTKLTAELLDKVAKELGVSPVDILSHEPAFVNFGTVENNNQGHIENFHNFQKEFLEKIIASKDAEIERLHQLVGNLLKDKDKLMDLLKK